MVSRMADYLLPILREARDIIKIRGWAEGGTGTGKVNIRTAVKAATETTVGREPWYPHYIEVLNALRLQLNGIHFWEYGVARKTGGRRPRTHDEVVEKLSTIIDMLEHHEAQVGHSKRPGRSGVDKRPV
jgi:hypothetical protein